MDHVSRFWQRFLRIQPISDGDHHATYDFLYGMTIMGKPVEVVRLPSLYLHVDWPRLLRPFAPLLNHLAVTWQVVRGVLNRNYVIVREFRNGWFLLVSPLVWIMRNQFVLVINGNVPTAASRRFSEIAFWLLARMRFKLVFFEGEAASDHLRASYPRIRLATPLFCIRDLCPPPRTTRDRGAPFTVGLVGDFRPEKGGLATVREVIARVRQIPGVVIAIGYRNRGLAHELAIEGVQLRYTGEYSEYLAFLRSCDVVLMTADRSAYEFRHSGAVFDCMGQRDPVICPDCRLFTSSVTRPVRVGLTYSGLSELPELIREAMRTVEQFREDFDRYFYGRGTDQVKELLERFS